MKTRRYSGYVKSVFFLCDIILLNSMYLISYFLRYGSLSRFTSIPESVTVLLIANLLWALLIINLKAYEIVRVGHTENVIMQILKIIGIHLILIFSVLLLLKFHEISRLRLLYFYSLLIVASTLFRIVFIRVLKHYRKIGYNFRTVVIMGMGNAAFQLYSFFSKDLSLGYKVLGFFDDNPEDYAKRFPVLGTTANVKTYIEQNAVDELYISSSAYSVDTVTEIIDACERNLVRVKIVPDFNKYTKNRKVLIDFYGNLPVVMLRKEPLESNISEMTKRMFDICFSLLFLVCISPWLFLVVAILVKWSSKGPVFFKQERSGENNKIFWCYKFRTMAINDLADEKQASKDDERVTPIGRWLRKTNIDELPQFVNVLKGDMSVVGPRPHMLKHTEEYSALIKNYVVRHFVKPGVTGWAQINGFRGETKELEQMEKRVEYDIWYIENWTFLLDIKIIFSTIFNMFKGDENAV